MTKADKKVQKPKQNFIQRFFKETVGELRKVSWPTRQETRSLTTVVIAVLVLMSAFLGTLDILFTRLFALILGS